MQPVGWGSLGLAVPIHGEPLDLAPGGEVLAGYGMWVLPPHVAVGGQMGLQWMNIRDNGTGTGGEWDDDFLFAPVFIGSIRGHLPLGPLSLSAGAGLGWRADASTHAILGDPNGIRDSGLLVFDAGVYFHPDGKSRTGVYLAYQHNRPRAFGPDLPSRLNLDLFIIKAVGEMKF